MTKKSVGSQVVEIVLRGSVYRVACEEGEKEAQRLLELANSLDKLLEDVAGSRRGRVSDSLLFLLAALKLQDKVEEVTRELRKVSEELSECRTHHQQEIQVRSSLEDLLRYSISRTRNLVAYIDGTYTKSVRDTQPVE